MVICLRYHPYCSIRVAFEDRKQTGGGGRPTPPSCLLEGRAQPLRWVVLFAVLEVRGG